MEHGVSNDHCRTRIEIYSRDGDAIEDVASHQGAKGADLVASTEIEAIRLPRAAEVPH